MDEAVLTRQHLRQTPAANLDAFADTRRVSARTDIAPYRF